MHVRFVEAKGFWRWWLRRNRFWAAPMPWGKVYCLRQHMMNPTLIVHELVHVEQMLREGRFKWSVKYLWYAATRGYWNNPYEIEAYRRSGYATDGG